MRKKVKVIGPKNNSTLLRMELGGFMGTDPGNIFSKSKESEIERVSRTNASAGNRIKYGVAGFAAPALEWVGAEDVGKKWEEKAIAAGAGQAFNTGDTIGEVGSAVGKFFTGDYQGMAGDLTESAGSATQAAGYAKYTKGKDKKAEKLINAGEAVEGIGGLVSKTSFTSGGGISSIGGKAGGAEGVTGMMGGGSFDINSLTEMNKTLNNGTEPEEFKKGGKIPLELSHVPKNGKIIDGLSHEEGGIITTSKNKPVAEVEGKEAMTNTGKVFSASLKSMSNPKKTFAELYKKVQKLEGITPEGQNTKRLAEESLFIEQEKSKELLQIENEANMAKYGKKLNLPKYEDGNSRAELLSNSNINPNDFVNKLYLTEARINEDKKNPIIAETNKHILLPIKKSPLLNTDPLKTQLTDKDLEIQDISPMNQNLQLPLSLQNNRFKNNTNSLEEDRVIRNRKQFNSIEPRDRLAGKRLERMGERPGSTPSEVEDTTKNKTLTPGDITQLSGNLIAPLANLAAAKGIEKDNVTFGKDRFTPREQRVSTADMERATRQEAAATRAGVQAMGAAGDAVKGSISSTAARSLQEAMFTAESKNKDLALIFDQIVGANNKYNIGQDDKTKLDARDRRDLGRTTRLTAAEQAGKAVVDLGAFKNQGLTNSVELKALQEAYPDYGINASNLKEFYKIAQSGDEVQLNRFKRKNGGTK